VGWRPGQPVLAQFVVACHKLQKFARAWKRASKPCAHPSTLCLLQGVSWMLRWTPSC